MSPELSLFGRYGWRDLNTNDQAPIPLPSGGGGNGNIYTRNKQLVFGATYVASDRSLLEVRFGWSNTQGGKNPPALGDGGHVRHHRAADRRTHRGRPAVAGDQRLLRRSAARRPIRSGSTRRSGTRRVNYSWLMGKQSLKAGYEFQRIDVEVQDVNPLYGLDSYTGQFTRPVSTAREQHLYNLADFMLGLRSQYALSTFFVANMRQHLHFTYVQDDIRVNDKLTLNAGLRYQYASPMWEANNALTNFDPVNKVMVTAKDGSIADRALVDPDRNNFGPRLGFAYTVAPRNRRPRRLGHQLRARQPHRIGKPARDQRSAGRESGRGAGRCRRRRRSGRPSKAIRQV